MKILVTGGCGFIGSHFIKQVLKQTPWAVINVDKLTYAANPQALADVEADPRYTFCRCDIVDLESIRELFRREQPTVVVHFAAESHVDRSITAPADFIQTNVVGTFNLLNCSLESWQDKNECVSDEFRFLHVSTDEVFGSLSIDDDAMNESGKYSPSSPYSATKAGSDHLALAWHATYGLPVVVTHCSNNYGAWQYPEKFIPTIISKAINEVPIPVYGDGKNVRDWLHVEDHCTALRCVLENGTPGETYNVGAENELSNLSVVYQVCKIVDELRDTALLGGHASLIEFVTDRKGHDFRYALDTKKIQQQLGWIPEVGWQTGLRQTVEWYMNNRSCWKLDRNAASNDDATNTLLG